MRIKGSDLRKIINEEIQRSVSAGGRRGSVIREEAMPVGKNLLAQAIETQGSVGLGGRRMPMVGLVGDLSTYQKAWEENEQVIARMQQFIPNTAITQGRLMKGYIDFAKRGSTSPLAPRIMQVLDENLSPPAKARAIFAVLAGGDYSSSADHAGGAVLGIDLQNYERDRFDSKLESSYPGNTERFLSNMEFMAGFNLPAAVEKQMARGIAPGTVTPGDLEFEDSL